jgi:hypothetical protein
MIKLELQTLALSCHYGRITDHNAVLKEMFSKHNASSVNYCSNKFQKEFINSLSKQIPADIFIEMKVVQ